MPEYLTPGVYVEEVSFRAPSIEGVGTSTTGFVGVTLTGPTVNSPKPTPELLTSFGDFQNIYGGYDNLAFSKITGDPQNVNYLAMAVKAFFDNGGSQLYVSRVFSPAAAGDLGIATDGSAAGATVAVKARFPGASGNQTVAVQLKTTKAQNFASLPTGSLVAYPGNTSSLANRVQPGDTQAVLAAPLPSTPPAGTSFTVLVDTEALTVTAVDSTGTKLTIAAAALSHAVGAPVLGQLGTVFATPVAGSPQLITISGLPAPPAGPTAGPTVTGTTGTTATTTTTAAPPAKALPLGNMPARLQIGAQTFNVTAVDATGTIVTVDQAAGPSVTAGTAVYAPIQYYANGTGSFAAITAQFPQPVTPVMYVLTMQVTASTAAGNPAVFDGLGFDPAHPYYLGQVLGATPPRHIDGLQNQVGFTIAPGTSATALFQAIFGNWSGPTSARVTNYKLKNGDDGAPPNATDYQAALALLTSLDDIAIVGAPGSGVFPSSADAINSLITHVSQQRAYRVAILETPPNQLASDNEGVRAVIDSSYAALYVPWIYTPNPLATAGSSAAAEIAVPPTGFMAGIWARSDEENGVSKAPANEVLLGASRLERDITFAEQGILNPLGINCLRYFPNRGFRVWGARTVSSDTEFMYLNVRRYLVYLEHSIDNSTQWAAFENNGPALWSRVKEAIESFLYSEYAAGNLLGDSPAQAYFVRCDRTTMTQNDLDNGRMICLIGVSVLKPAEFVIFRIGQTTALGQS